MMRQIKKALDPHMLMNPGKIFSATRDEIPRDCFKANSPPAVTTTSLHLEKADD